MTSASFLRGKLIIEIPPDKPGHKRARKRALKMVNWLKSHPRNAGQLVEPGVKKIFGENYFNI